MGIVFYSSFSSVYFNAYERVIFRPIHNFQATKLIIKLDRVVCPNFGHPALTSSFTKYKFLQVKNSFATIVNGLSVLKLFQLSNGDLLLKHLQIKVRKPRMTKLGQGVRKDNSLNHIKID